ncbi:MAG: sulfatase [Planctomycetaceae bacterium]|nr:sulfatase [Planctomycetaceae bacterium]
MLRSLIIFGALVLSVTASAAERMNVLFIASDDLRPELGCYGHPHVKSPNIDRLASEGTLFNRAYCQQAVCNPSRASLMTGLYPETLQVFDLPTHFRDKKPDAVTIAQHFREQGYYTERVGKIFHVGHGNHDDKFSWSVMRNHPSANRFGPEGQAVLKREKNQAGQKKGAATKDRVRGLPWEAPEVGDSDLTDGATTDAVIEILNEVQDRPFFVACGFANPHLPFVAPKKYWDLYDPASIELADNPYPPHDAPKCAATSWGEMRAYVGIPPKGPLGDAQARQAIHAYWAAVSYVDAQVGRLLDELDRLQLREKTVVILWGDHGWQLGEHGFWCKHTNYEVAARVPLIISVPGQSHRGAKTDRLVEFVDVFPSLCDACSLSPPQGLEGTSFLPLVEQPDRPWKQAAFHLYPRSIADHGPAMGRAVRTDRYRMVEWKAERDGFTEYELYDLETDPDENQNVAGKSEYAQVLTELQAIQAAGPRGARP